MTRSLTKADLQSGQDLLAMLSFRRPNGTKAEKEFIARFITPLGAKPDKRGNYRLQIGNEPVLWSCHTDTVHFRGGRQKLAYVGPGILGLDETSISNCLGADDTAGCWLMREMILAKVPGLYVFHRSEEIGGLGSKWIAKHNPEIMANIKATIALDRKDKSDVITHQIKRTCSDTFAGSLAEQLGMGYKPSSHGMFTDTANYTGLVGECTNLSVGYQDAHSANEKLDEQFLFELKEKLIHLDVNKLEFERKPGETQDYAFTQYEGAGYYEGYSKRTPWTPPKHSPSVVPTARSTAFKPQIQNLEGYVRVYPDVVADILEEWGYDAKTLGNDILKRLNGVKV